MPTERVDHAGRGTENARQGTGPRQTVSVLILSLLMAVAAGIAIILYFVLR